MRLKRRLTGFYTFSKNSAVAAAALAAALAAGCSSDFSRFTDGISKSSAPQHTPYVSYPPAPVNNSPYSGKVESSTLAPPPGAETGASAAPMAAASPQPAQNAASAPDEANKHKIIYQVVSGDTLLGLSRRYDTNIADIKRDNQLSSNKILIGQKLTIFTARKNANNAAPATEDKTNTGKAKNPAAVPVPTPDPEDTAKSAPADNSTNAEANSAADSAAANQNNAPQQDNSAAGGAAAAAADSAAHAQTPAPAEQNLAANVPPAEAEASASAAKDSAANTAKSAAPAEGAAAAAKPAAAAQDNAPMIWPVNGNIISSYGQRTGTTTNDGIDIAVPEGTPVKAADGGTVIYAGDGLKEFGNTILIRHEDNIVTVYGHNSKLLVSRGQQVQKGQTIAQSGSSGNAAVAKLHFEVRKNSAPVDPMKYLPLPSAH